MTEPVIIEPPGHNNTSSLFKQTLLKDLQNQLHHHLHHDNKLKMPASDHKKLERLCIDDVGDDGDQEHDGDAPTSANKIKISHVKQASNWDCGLACVKMVLKTYDKNIEDFEKVCNKLNLRTRALPSTSLIGFFKKRRKLSMVGNCHLCGGQFQDISSIWTIDLAYILHFYNINSKYATITLGVDESYANKAFYKDSFVEDARRVEAMFIKAEQIGVKIVEKSTTLVDIIDHLKSKRPIIILIDWNIIKWTKGLSLNCKCFGSLLKKVSSYQGHYIVLNGYNSKKNIIYYHNPEKGDETYSINADVLEKARKSYGTDEDTIFIKEKL